jgi:hypothetical protein
MSVFWKYILHQPSINVIMLSTCCSSINIMDNDSDLGYSYYNTIQILLILFSMLVLVMIVCLEVVMILLFCDEDLDSKLPWAHCKYSLVVFNFLRKLLISISIYLCKSNTESGNILMFLITFLILIILFLLQSQLYMKDRKILYIMFFSEGMVAWFILLSGFQLLTDKSFNHPIILFPLVLVFTICMVIINDRRTCALMAFESIVTLKSEAKVKAYCYLLIDKLYDKRQSSKLVIKAFMHVH